METRNESELKIFLFLRGFLFLFGSGLPLLLDSFRGNHILIGYKKKKNQMGNGDIRVIAEMELAAYHY
jgi:hypothetical protein